MLGEANSDIATLIGKSQANLINAGSKESDIYFKGDLLKWQKVINAMTLRLLIHLSKQEGDADLNVKQKFAAIMGDPTKYPLLSGMADNMQFEYNATRNKYPNSPDNFGFDALRYNMAATHLNNLAMLKDPRTFVVAEPAAAKVAGGLFDLGSGNCRCSGGKGCHSQSPRDCRSYHPGQSRPRNYKG